MIFENYFKYLKTNKDISSESFILMWQWDDVYIDRKD